MKTISVLIAAWQAHDWLKDCLTSVFSQSLPTGWKLEVLLGVDGCEDTLLCALKLDFPELNTLHIQNNVGTYITFNTLMRCAEGELIARFDADDVMLPGYLARQINKIESGVDLVRSWFIYTDEKLQPTSYVVAHNIHYQHGGYHKKPSDGQFVVKRDVLEKLGGFRSWRCAADTDFINRLKIAGYNIAVIEEHLFKRRSHQNSLTAHPSSNYQSSLRQELSTVIEEYEKEYHAGKRSMRINPELAKAQEHKEIWHQHLHVENENSKAPMVVVLDIDETILHATPEPLTGTHDYATERLWVYKRPHVDEFFNYLQENFLIGAWTSACASYANEIFSEVFPTVPMEFIFNSGHCLSALDEKGEEVSIKPLKKLNQFGFELQQIIMIDDSPEKHRLNPHNLLAVNPFRASEKEKQEDKTLKELITKLKEIKRLGFMPTEPLPKRFQTGTKTRRQYFEEREIEIS